MRWQLIESDEALVRLLAQQAQSRVVMVDTEFMRRNTFYPEVALVQLCFAEGGSDVETAWLIDPLRIQDPTPLARLLTDPGVTKVLHSASEDLEVFQRWLGVMPQPLFDTQRAAALVDMGFGLGYRTLVKDVCSIDLPKGETQSDWLQRPLTESQCEYAGFDVTWLLPVWREINARCTALERLQWVLEDGRDATNMLGTEITDVHKRIKTAWKLNRRQLGILIDVCQWRETTAKSRNKPRGWIIDDQACLQLALNDPKTIEALRERAELPHAAIQRYGQQLLELLAAQRAIPDSALPLELPGPLGAGERNQIKGLKARVRDIATQLTLAPEVLVPSKDYELLLREQLDEQFQAPEHWRGWRESVVYAPLRHIIAEAIG